MPLVVYLVPGATGDVRRGDMVFHIAVPEGEKWKPRWLAHTGIVEQTLTNYQLRAPAMVIHMGYFITKDVWTGGINEDELRIDVCGTRSELDDLTRDSIIDEARVYYEIDPSIFEGERVHNCYWMGDPLPNSHPLFPFSRSVYGFSCSSFAHYCYERVGSPILNTATMPTMTDAERLELEGILSDRRIQTAPFSRLYPSYLMSAFRTDSYPFSPDDWESCKAHGAFIPAEVAA
jgi:hypothetical protein